MVLPKTTQGRAVYGSILAFVTGAWVLQWIPNLPPRELLWLLPLPALIAWRVHCLRLPAIALLGLLWALLSISAGHPGALAPALEGEELQVIGRVVGLPSNGTKATRFDLQLEQLMLADEEVAGPKRIRLSWYQEAGSAAPQLVPGERWQLRVRLKRPHGFSNPGGFDYQGWLFREGIGARGYIRRSDDNRRLEAATGWSVDRWRQRIGQRIDTLVARAAAAQLKALVIGDRSDLTRAQWQIFSRTGTSHLVAISGLHVGLVAGLVLVLMRWLWSRSAWLATWLAAPRAAALCALAAAPATPGWRVFRSRPGVR